MSQQLETVISPYSAVCCFAWLHYVFLPKRNTFWYPLAFLAGHFASFFLFWFRKNGWYILSPPQQSQRVAKRPNLTQKRFYWSIMFFFTNVFSARDQQEKCFRWKESTINDERSAYQGRIQDFLGGGANSKGRDANLLFGKIFPKSAWEWRKLDGEACVQYFTM